MNATLRNISLAVALATVALACQEGPPPLDSTDGRTTSVPAEGEYLSYTVSGADGADEDRILDACSLTGAHSIVVIARLTSEQTHHPSDCPDLTWPSHHRREIAVEHVILGAIEDNVTFVYGRHRVAIGRPDVGDRFLLELRKRDGLYVGVAAIEVSLEPDEETAVQNTQGIVDLPSAISDLKVEVQTAQGLDSCPDSERNPIVEMSADDYETLLLDPEICEDPNPIPSGRCQVDSDCSPAMVCTDGRCRDECDPSETDGGCLLSDGD